MSKKDQFKFVLTVALSHATDARKHHEEGHPRAGIIEVFETQKGVVWAVLGARPDYLDTCEGWNFISDAVKNLIDEVMAADDEKDARRQLINDFCEKYVWSAE